MLNEVDWLPLERLARIEASSSRDSHPAIRAVSAETERGWRAAGPGEQWLAIVFHEACDIGRVRLVIVEDRRERTQEFTLQWSSNRGETHREIVRQQFTFSPAGATREVEDYQVELRGATRLELRIVPDIKGGDAIASVREFRVAPFTGTDAASDGDDGQDEAEAPESALDVAVQKLVDLAERLPDGAVEDHVRRSALEMADICSRRGDTHAAIERLAHSLRQLQQDHDAGSRRHQLEGEAAVERLLVCLQDELLPELRRVGLA